MSLSFYTTLLLVLNVTVCFLLSLLYLVSHSLVVSDDGRDFKRLWATFAAVIVLFDLLSIATWGVLTTCRKNWRTMLALINVHRCIQDTCYKVVGLGGVVLVLTFEVNLQEILITLITFIYCILQIIYIDYYYCKIDFKLRFPEEVKMNIPRPKMRIRDLKRRPVEGERADIDSCSVCLEDLDDNDKVYDLYCKHYFHVACLDSHVANRGTTCPNCRMHWDGRRDQVLAPPVREEPLPSPPRSPPRRRDPSPPRRPVSPPYRDAGFHQYQYDRSIGRHGGRHDQHSGRENPVSGRRLFMENGAVPTFTVAQAFASFQGVQSFEH